MVERKSLFDKDGYKGKINLKTSLDEFISLTAYAYKKRLIERNLPTSRVIGMLYRLDTQSGIGTGGFVPRKISAIDELYSFSHEEILKGFWGYKKKTWHRLNEILNYFNMPSIDLPKEYIENP